MIKRNYLIIFKNKNENLRCSGNGFALVMKFLINASLVS